MDRLVALQVVQKDFGDAVARVGAPDAACVVVVVHGFVDQGCGALLDVFGREFAKRVERLHGVGQHRQERRVKGNRIARADRAVDVGLVAQFVVLVGGKNGLLGGLRQRAQTGDGLPGFGQVALGVVSAVMGAVFCVGGLQGVAQGVVDHRGAAVFGRGIHHRLVARRCGGRGAVGTFDGQDGVAIGVAFELSDWGHLGARAVGQEACGCHHSADAAQGVVIAAGDATGCVGGGDEVAYGVIVVNG